MTLGSFVRWLGPRAVCSVRGHAFKRARVMASWGPTQGFACRRCDASTPHLWRWQERVDDAD